jgi:TRAP-type uncharacterized transport system fused permease subunit
MRLGSIIYFVPFFFVLDTAFILRAPWEHIIMQTTLALIGIVLLASALQGYLIGIGNLTNGKLMQWPIRGAILLAGLLIATPGGGLLPWSNMQGAGAGAAFFALALMLFYGSGRKPGADSAAH